MKGVVFTEFLDMVEGKFSLITAERIIERCDLPSGGIYTAVGTYDHDEMVALVMQLSKETGVPIPDLLRTFGEFLFGRFVEGYPAFFEEPKTTFAFLDTVHDHIHVEVRKLDAKAELPTLECRQPAPGKQIVTYRSARGLADLAEGLIRAAIAHYGEDIALSMEDLSGGDKTEVRFVLDKAA